MLGLFGQGLILVASDHSLTEPIDCIGGTVNGQPVPLINLTGGFSTSSWLCHLGYFQGRPGTCRVGGLPPATTLLDISILTFWKFGITLGFWRK